MSKENPAVKEIVMEYLKNNNYDGLVHESGCGCGIDKIGDCEALSETCQAAYKQKPHCSNCGTQCDGVNGDEETYCYTTDINERSK